MVPPYLAAAAPSSNAHSPRDNGRNPALTTPGFASAAPGRVRALLRAGLPPLTPTRWPDAARYCFPSAPLPERLAELTDVCQAPGRSRFVDTDRCNNPCLTLAIGAAMDHTARAYTRLRLLRVTPQVAHRMSQSRGQHGILLFSEWLPKQVACQVR